jgi:hypothetical protein
MVIPDRVACPSDPDGLHHARVAQLSAAQLSVKHLDGKIVSNVVFALFFTNGIVSHITLQNLPMGDGWLRWGRWAAKFGDMGGKVAGRWVAKWGEMDG